MAGEINLEVVADIAKAKAGLADLAASVKNIEKATGQTGRSSDALGQSFGKAAQQVKQLAAATVGIASLGAAISWAKREMAQMLDNFKAAGGAIKVPGTQAKAFAQAFKGPGAGEVLASAQRTGAALGLAPEEVTKAAVATAQKMRGATPEEVTAGIGRTMQLMHAGYDLPEAVKRQRRGAGEVSSAMARHEAFVSGYTPAARADLLSRYEAEIGVERLLPSSEIGQSGGRAAENAALRSRQVILQKLREGLVGDVGTRTEATTGEVLGSMLWSQDTHRGIYEEEEKFRDQSAHRLERAARSLEVAAEGGSR
ncbi:MAG TPA: hypothetical protein PK280_14040 [Planctomycetota bacterium]|nr:hypothetical protein [Planctomycetota bacterium]